MDSPIKKLAPRILQLLHRRNIPVVDVRASSIPNAGNGVYTATTISAGELLCLYPGVYSPGLPQWMMTRGSFDDTVSYLGSLMTPSGVLSENNGYILNLQIPTGGYIDAMALSVRDTTCQPSKSSRLRRLDENPSCCAHLMNHSRDRSNVEVIPFCWMDVFSRMSGINEDMFELPNVLRRDCAPHYSINSDIIYYDNVSSNLTSQPSSELVFGAAMCSTKDIERDVELFLDYKLKAPLPLWAESWYDDLS